MVLAKKLYTDDRFTAAFNFDPNPSDNRTVEDVIQTALQSWAGTYHVQSNDKAPHEAGLLKLSIEKSRAQLGWEPRWDFDEAVAKTMGWYLAVHEGQSPLEVTQDQIEAFEAA